MNRSETCRIAFVIPSLIRGGSEGRVWELIRRMDRTVFAPSLVLFEEVTGGYPREALDCDVRIIGVPAGRGRRWFRKGLQHGNAFRLLCRCLRELSPHAVHTALPAAAILGCPAARLVGVPLTIAGRSSLFFYRQHAPVLALADRHALRFADAVITNCSPIARLTAEQDGFPADRVFTIENGVDCERFRPDGDPYLRRQFGWSSEHVVLGMMANFYAYKRHADFLHAAARIHAAFPQTRFLLVGRQEDAFADAMRLRSQLGLEGVVQIMPGTSAPESVYAALDAYLSTSATEGLSNTLLEAMACGLPTIATNVGGNPDVVRHGETGLLARPFAPGEIAVAARVLISNPALRRHFGKRGCALARERFSLDRMVHAHEALYLSLLEKKMALGATPAAILETV